MTTTPHDPQPTSPDEQPAIIPSLDPDQPEADPQTRPAPEPERA